MGRIYIKQKPKRRKRTSSPQPSRLPAPFEEPLATRLYEYLNEFKEWSIDYTYKDYNVIKTFITFVNGREANKR